MASSWPDAHIRPALGWRAFGPDVPRARPVHVWRAMGGGQSQPVPPLSALRRPSHPSSSQLEVLLVARCSRLPSPWLEGLRA